MNEAEYPTTRHFRPGSLLIAEGDEGDTAYLILTGCINVKSKALQQETYLGQHAIVGAEALFGDRQRVHTATVAEGEKCTAIEIPRGYFKKSLEQSDPIVRGVMQYLGQCHIHRQTNTLEIHHDPGVIISHDVIEHIKLANEFREALERN